MGPTKLRLIGGAVVSSGGQLSSFRAEPVPVSQRRCSTKQWPATLPPYDRGHVLGWNAIETLLFIYLFSIPRHIKKASP